MIVFLVLLCVLLVLLVVVVVLLLSIVMSVAVVVMRAGSGIGLFQFDQVYFHRLRAIVILAVDLVGVVSTRIVGGLRAQVIIILQISGGAPVSDQVLEIRKHGVEFTEEEIRMSASNECSSTSGNTRGKGAKMRQRESQWSRNLTKARDLYRIRDDDDRTIVKEKNITGVSQTNNSAVLKKK